MDCRSCGTVNATARRYCRECGVRLGNPCDRCFFFNAAEDKFCGGCGRALRLDEPAAEAAGQRSYAPVPGLTDDMGLGEEEAAVPLGEEVAAGADAAGEVSQSEIDGLFENLLGETKDRGEGE